MRYSLFNPLFDRRVFMGEPSGGGGGGGEDRVLRTTVLALRVLHRRRMRLYL